MRTASPRESSRVETSTGVGKARIAPGAVSGCRGAMGSAAVGWAVADAGNSCAARAKAARMREARLIMRILLEA